ncbi:MAG TPA: hypothetical protein VHB98_17625, partial [Chloroflexota bacterium]|nr:hypothetical protein [Chloroflexota bacterium]
AMVVTGTFATPTQVSQAIDALLAEGFTSDQISAVTASGHPLGDLTPTTTDKVNEILGGAGLGALIGAVVGLALAPVLLPGAVLLVAAGELVTGGALAGGLIGALVRMGHSTEQAEALVEQVKSGRYLVTVRAADADAALQAETVLQNAGAEQVHTSQAAA